MSDRLLFIGGGRETTCAMGKAKSLGYDVFCTDADINAYGIKWAKRHGKWFGIANTYDLRQTLNCVRDIDVDGVVAVACDVGPTVSYVAAAKNCVHIPVSTTILGQRKDNLKAVLSERDKSIKLAKDKSDSDSEYIVVKPVDGRGARGVFRVRRNDERLLDYRYYARKESSLGLVIEEEWVEGPQISTETLVYKGIVQFTGMTDRFYHYLSDQYPYVIENGGIGPSKYENTKEGFFVKNLVRKIVRALEIQSGTIKCDIVLDANDGYKPTLIECAIGRMSGGYMCSHYLPIAYGVDFLKNAFDVACGRIPDMRPVKKSRFVCGQYEYDKNWTKMKDRGRFFLAIADSREEALEKSWRYINEKRPDYCLNRKMWERAVS